MENKMKIWIFNHYATNQYIDGTGRHQGLAKYLIRKGHDVKIFCADTVHNSNETTDIKKGCLSKHRALIK